MWFGVSEVLSFINARVINADSIGEAKLGEIRVDRPAALGKSATGTTVAFFFSKHYEMDLMASTPGILVTGEAMVTPLLAHSKQLPFWDKTAVVACADPYFAMAVISEKFAKDFSRAAHIEFPSKSNIHPTAVIHPSVRIGRNVEIGPFVVIDENSEIGEGSIIEAGCVLGHSVKVGSRSVLFPRVTVYEFSQIGDRARIHSGVVIGSDGFGYAPRMAQKTPGATPQVVGHQKIYHLGKVVIGNDVEIGANSCVDRGTLGDTMIEDDVKLDNHVQVAHNVHLGRGTVICGSSGFAGSASSGEFVYVGGLAGIKNQVHVGDRALVGAGSMVSKDVPADGSVVGNPQRDHKAHFKAHAWLSRMSVESKKKRGGE